MPSRRKSTPCKILTAHQPEITTIDSCITQQQHQSSGTDTTNSGSSGSSGKMDHSPAPTGSDTSDQVTAIDTDSIVKVQPESPGECSRRVKDEGSDDGIPATSPILLSSATSSRKDPVPFSPKNFTDENLILHYMRENSKLVASILAEKDLSGDHKELCLQQIITCVKNARDKLRNSNSNQVWILIG